MVLNAVDLPALSGRQFPAHLFVVVFPDGPKEANSLSDGQAFFVEEGEKEGSEGTICATNGKEKHSCSY